MPSMYDHLGVLLPIIPIAMLASFIEVIAYARLSPQFLRRIAKPHAIPASASPVHIDRLEPLPKHDDLVFKRRDRTLLVRRSLIGRRAGAWALADVAEDGTVQVAWAAYPTFGWIPITIAFGLFAGMTLGSGSWIAAGVFAGLFTIVAVVNLRQSRQAFEQVVWPGLGQLLNSATNAQAQRVEAQQAQGFETPRA